MANLFGKYKENRVYNPIITGGAGFIADSKGGNYSQAVQFAFINKFRVSKAWDINLDIKGAWIGNDFDAEGGSRGDGLFSVGLSATYRFKTRKFVPYQPKYIKDTKAANEWKAKYDAANNKAGRLQAENNDLKMVGTGLHTGSLKCIIGNIKAKRMETRITRVFFKYALREKGWERNE